MRRIPRPNPCHRDTVPPCSNRPLTRRVAGPAEVLAELPLTATLAAELAAGAIRRPVGGRVRRDWICRCRTAASIRGVEPLWSVQSAGRAWLLRERTGMLQVLAEAAPAAGTLVADPRDARPALSLRGATRPGPTPGSRCSTCWAATGSTGTWSSRPSTTAPSLCGSATASTVCVHPWAPSSRPPTGSATAWRATSAGHGIAHAVTAVTADREGDEPAAGRRRGSSPRPPTRYAATRRDAFAVQERAVTEADYAEVGERSSEVQRAAATFRWTGSWHTVFVTADRFGGGAGRRRVRGRVRDWLERYRMAGYDLEVDAPVFVPLEIGLHVCVAPGYFRSDVAAEVRAVLSDAVLPDGSRGLFHPDRPHVRAAGLPVVGARRRRTPCAGCSRCR